VVDVREEKRDFWRVDPCGRGSPKCRVESLRTKRRRELSKRREGEFCSLEKGEIYEEFIIDYCFAYMYFRV